MTLNGLRHDYEVKSRNGQFTIESKPRIVSDRF